MELFREDSGMTTHTTGTGSALGFEANAVHGAVELCGLTSLPTMYLYSAHRAVIFAIAQLSCNTCAAASLPVKLQSIVARA